MEKFLLCLLAAVVVLVVSSSMAAADCPDATYACQHWTRSDYPTVTVGYCSQSAGFLKTECRICGSDEGKPAKLCNERYPEYCKGQCYACRLYPWTRECWDVNGQLK